MCTPPLPHTSTPHLYRTPLPHTSTRRALTLTLPTLTLSQTLSRTLSRTLTRHKVWLKPSAEQSFLYGNHVLKAGCTTHYALCTTHYSLLTTHYALFTTFC